MAASIGSSDIIEPAGIVTGPIRVLCLGNEIVSDDAVGPVVAERLRGRLALEGAPLALPDSGDPAVTVNAFELPRVGPVELVETALTGMYLLDFVIGASRLIVVDSAVTGAAASGTVMELTERDLDGPRGTSAHYIGLLETLEMARALGLGVPPDVTIVAVEAGDYWTIGGAMTAGVRAAVPVVVERTMALISDGPASSGTTPLVGDATARVR
jgi:hydrogenase maturation protease